MSRIHIMLDLETFGTSNNAMIASIGSCYFEPRTSKIGRKFIHNVNDPYGKSDEATIRWWLKQSTKAQEGLESPKPVHIAKALGDLTDFFPKNAKLWSHSFDTKILHSSFAFIGRQAPWHYRDEIDIRTFTYTWNILCDKGYDEEESILDQTDFPVEYAGIKHNALDDAIFQARYISHMWQELMHVR